MLILVQCIAVQYQDKIHKMFKNKTLAFLAIPVFVSFMVIGVVVKFCPYQSLTIMLVFAMFGVQHFLRAPYWTLENKYMTNFTDDSIRVKILSVNKIMKAILKIAITFLAGLLLEHNSTSQAYFIIGSVGLVMILGILKYMQKRVGLKPEEYSKQDIEYIN